MTSPRHKIIVRRQATANAESENLDRICKQLCMNHGCVKEVSDSLHDLCDSCRAERVAKRKRGET